MRNMTSSQSHRFNLLRRLSGWIACGGFCFLLGACSTVGPTQSPSVVHIPEPQSKIEEPVDGSEPLPENTLEASYRKSPHRHTVNDLPSATDYSRNEPRPSVDDLMIAPEWTRTPEDRPGSQPAPPPVAPPAAEEDHPQLWVDDMSRASLKLAIRRQLQIMQASDLNHRVRIGNRRVSRRHLMITLQAFMKLLKENLSSEEFNRRLNEEFLVITAGYRRAGRPALFTGYYTPIIPAKREKGEGYVYPLYQKPDWYPEAASPPHPNRVRPISARPHETTRTKKALLTRRDIDGRRALSNQNLELAWLEDDLERYFLHIQGSGFLQFPDGTLQAVAYMGSNHYPYRSVGRQMIQDGIISPAQGSMQGMKRYFREHPENIDKFLFRNNRYIFFRMSDRSPQGSSGAELVAGRSIATDKSLYPAGGLAYITVKKPILDDNLNITGWQKVSRFVLDQDTGSAIKGPGRVDLYFGVGDAAGAAAGHYKQTGTLVYLLKK